MVISRVGKHSCLIQAIVPSSIKGGHQGSKYCSSALQRGVDSHREPNTLKHITK